jgi:hypothetical protein
MAGDRSGRGIGGVLARLIAALVLSWFLSQRLVTFLARPNKEDLTITHARPPADRKAHTGHRQALQLA